ncbi:MAG TPA: carboxypeptidase regulatory-like domain-containing protein [Terriglobales bacterium]
MMRKIFILYATLAITTIAHAQGLGSIVGTITDPSGAAVSSAQVKVTDAGTGLSREVSSDAQGYYVVSSLRPSQYTLDVNAPNFRKYTAKQITLLADQNLTMNVKLEVGSASEVIEVSSNALEVNTVDSTQKQVIEERRISELPLNGRNAAELTLLVPGAVAMPAVENPNGSSGGGANQGVSKTFPGGVTISTNGSRQNQISYQLDGGNNVDEYTNINQPFPFPDALQEFSVQTSNYTAEYGQNAGGVVNIVTRSGSNSIHGDAFEFLRNAVFNARNTFANPTSKDNGRDQLKRNQFGGTIGGPIIHDRTFFFAGYQGTRYRNLGTPTITSVPNAGDRAAIAAGDPASAKLLPFLPVGDANGNITFSRPDRRNTDEVVSKIDHSLRQADQLTFRHYYARFQRDPVFSPTNILTWSDGSTIISQNFLIHESHIFGSSKVNDFRFSYARETSNRGPASNVPSVADLGVNIYQPPAGQAIQSINVQGPRGFSFGDNPHATFARNNFTWSDDYAATRGAHELHFGGVIERSRVDVNNPGFFGYGTFTFSSLANFEAGKLSNFQQGAGEFKNNRGLFAGVYAQDNFKVNRRLTLNLGVRYEPGLPWREDRNRVEEFVISQAVPGGQRSTVYPNAPPGLFFVGDKGMPQNGVKASLNNIAPRVGFAYDVFGDGRTSLRGGGGIFYDTRITGIINNRMVDLTPFSPQIGPLTPPGPFSDPYCQKTASCQANAIANPFPIALPVSSNYVFPTPLQAISYDPSSKYKIQTLYNWNLSLEHQYAAGFLMRMAYVGSHGTHLKETGQLNPAFPGSGTTNLDARRRLNLAFPGCSAKTPTACPYNNVYMDLQDINSMYHSLQMSLEKRMSHGLTLLGNYTWSKSIDDLPVGGGVSEIAADSVSVLPYDNPLRHRFDRGPSDFDHTHRFVGSYVWALPKAGGNKLLQGFLGDWQLSGIFSAQTGRPFTVLSGRGQPNDPSQTGIGQDRGVLLAGASPYGPGACAGVNFPNKCVAFLNRSSFAQPAIGTFGNIGKGSLRWPGSYGWDMGLQKAFPVTERVNLQFRAEFFNVLNHVNYRSDESAISSAANSNGSSFGRFTSAEDPRIGQLALKIVF